MKKRLWSALLCGVLAILAAAFAAAPARAADKNIRLKLYIAEPVTGQKPSYQFDARNQVLYEGEYVLDSSYTAGPWKNGIAWYDVTADRCLRPDLEPDYTFAEGHTYCAFWYVSYCGGYSGGAKKYALVNDQYAVDADYAWVRETKDGERGVCCTFFTHGITRAELWVMPPVYGANVGQWVEQPGCFSVPENAHYDVSRYNTRWCYDRNGDPAQRTVAKDEDSFTEDSYYLSQCLWADYKNGWGFDRDCEVYLNGQKVSTWIELNGRRIHFFPPIQTRHRENQILIASASGLDQPRGGAQPDTDAVSGNETAYRLDSVLWYRKDGDLLVELAPGEAFVQGESYAADLRLTANEGYEFFIGANRDPQITALVNDSMAEALRAFEQDPYKTIDLRYDFGVCNGAQLREVRIVGIDPPVPGRGPSYDARVDGSGYRVYTEYGYDAEWYHKGVGWLDLTADETLGPGDAFIAGHEYQVRIKLKCEEGFAFDPPAQISWRYLNGVNCAAEDFVLETETKHPDEYDLNMKYTFRWSPPQISRIDVWGVALPVGSDAPYRAAAAGEPALYDLADYGPGHYGYNWYALDENGSETLLGENDRFLGGARYKLELKLTRTMYAGQYPGCTFAAPLTVGFNGETVFGGDTPLYGAEVYVANQGSTVMLYLTFTAKPEPLQIALLDRHDGGARVGLSNQGAEAVPMSFLLAAYDADGRMAALTRQALTLGADSSLPVDLSWAPGAQVKTLKAFCLEPETCAPLRQIWEE